MVAFGTRLCRPLPDPGVSYGGGWAVRLFDCPWMTLEDVSNDCRDPPTCGHPLCLQGGDCLPQSGLTGRTHSLIVAMLTCCAGEQVVMDFRRAGFSGEVLEKVPVLLPARSLLVMRGAARYLWSHCIATRLYDQLPHGDVMPRNTRVSVTFRTVREVPCICNCGQ